VSHEMATGAGKNAVSDWIEVAGRKWMGAHTLKIP
jgi:hypothetical protein